MTTDECPTTTFRTVSMALPLTSRDDIAATDGHCRLVSIVYFSFLTWGPGFRDLHHFCLDTELPRIPRLLDR